MFRLAGHLKCFVSDIEDGMAYTELIEWLAYYQIDPYGEVRDDLRAGVVAAQVFNAQLDRKTRNKAKGPADFILFDPCKREKSPQDVDNQIMSAFGLGKPNG